MMPRYLPNADTNAAADNTGSYADLVHKDTIEAVSRQFPRLRWSNCFTDTIHKENALKPWAHTTALGEAEFPAKVLGNTLMAPYE
jgi:cyanamide hydratase